MTEPVAHRGTGDAGTTLIEILMAVALVGIAFVALLAGMATVSLGSDIHRKQSDAEVALTSAVELLKDPAVAHVPCATPTEASYVDVVQSARPSGWPASSIRILEVQYWTGDGFTPDRARCLDELEPRLQLQQITVEVRSPDVRAVETITIVRAPAKAGTP